MNNLSTLKQILIKKIEAIAETEITYRNLYDALKDSVDESGIVLDDRQSRDLETQTNRQLKWFLEDKDGDPTTLNLAILLTNVVKRLLSSHTHLSKSDFFIDPTDPHGLKVDYSGVDFRLNPKRGKYNKWFNLIRFNADQHFPERYKSAYDHLYQGATRDGKSPVHDDLDRDARSVVYQTLTGPQLSDYYQRLLGEPSNLKLLPVDDDLKPSKLVPRGKLWATRSEIFGKSSSDKLPEDLETERESGLQRGRSRLSRSRKMPPMTEESIGADLDLPELMSSDDYRALRGKVRQRMYKTLVKAGILDPNERISRQYQKRREAWLENEIDKHMREKYLHFALDRPRTRWYSTFWGMVGKHYPGRYNSIAEHDRLNKYADSSELRHRTYRAFTQKQLDDWVRRVTHETSLMGHRNWLPSSRDLRVKPDFTEENRKYRLGQFARSEKATTSVEKELSDDEDMEEGDAEPTEIARRLALWFANVPQTQAAVPGNAPRGEGAPPISTPAPLKFGQELGPDEDLDEVGNPIPREAESDDDIISVIE